MQFLRSSLETKSTFPVQYKFRNGIKSIHQYNDPVTWQEKQLGVSLFSNQMEITDALFDKAASNVNILGCRGSGKSQGLGYALAALCSTVPNQHVISTAPILPQAGRIIRYVKQSMQSQNSKVKDLVDWQASSALRLVFKNGNTIVGVSGQEKAQTEGEHGNIIVIDEAHLVPGYSLSSKLMPMLSGIGVQKKLIKLGVAMGKGHFYKSFTAKDAKNCICKWNQAEIHLMETNPLFYKGKQYSRLLWGMMPIEYKDKYFHDRPDLNGDKGITGLEISVLDWLTQYELEWIDDINNFLTEKEVEMLGSGKHEFLFHGKQGERYFAGLDTSQGSWAGRRDTDWTSLTIWRLNRNKSVDKVASYRWQNDPVGQEQEIWDICHPKHGIFKCEIVFADYSNVGVSIVRRFREAGMPITGVPFGASAKTTGSAKNWKNTLFDNFLINLQSKLIRYPNMDKLRKHKSSANAEEKIQIENIMDDFDEWKLLQRVKGRGINDQIAAPTDLVEDENDVSMYGKVVHDDSCCADVLGCYAAMNPMEIKKLMAKTGALQGYQIPEAITGLATSSGFTGSTRGILGGASGENPLAQAEKAIAKKGIPDATPAGALSGTPLSEYSKMNIEKKKK